MAFVSFRFVAFMAILLILYFIIPKKYQWGLLLLGSYVFYVFASPYFLIFLLVSTITTYLCGYLLGRESSELSQRLHDGKGTITKEVRKEFKMKSQKRKKMVLVVCIITNLLILGTLKYFNFFSENITALLQTFGSHYEFPRVNWLLPLGISFYTFQTIGYCVDVYREMVEPQRNIFKYALFVSFFPQISQGPINRYGEMSTQLYAEHSFDVERLKKGGYRVLIGLFKKLTIADRLGIYVDRVYGTPMQYGSLTLLFATIFYAIQIYCDFSGYMDIAIGIGNILGIDMAENFNKPYFSKSISEYWRRWHITLGAWFRDYLYYPVIRSAFCTKSGKSLSARVSKVLGRTIPTVIGLLVVWFMTGLWHGASWHYVMHGLYHGTLIILSILFATMFAKLRTVMRIKDDAKGFHLFQMIRTFILVDISYILFRSTSLKDAGYIMKQIFVHMDLSIGALKDALMPFTEDNTAVSHFGVVAAMTLLLFIYEVLDYNGVTIVKKHKYLNAVIMIAAVLLFGVFGQSSFIYMQY